MTEQELEQALEIIQQRFDMVNQHYIRRIAKQIKKIGELSQSSINMLVVMAEVTSDVEEITRMLMAAVNVTKPEIQAIYTKAMQDIYTDPRFTKAFQAGLSVPPRERQRLVTYTQLVVAQTNLMLDNLSNTTAISEPYKNAVDKAVYAVSSGLTSYSMATRSAIRQVGYNGMQVYYASGYHRRLDTAIRQNVVDATKQINQHGADAVGQALGYDAKELSAHMNSAPDHEPVQGHILLNDEFDKMQAGQAFTDIDGVHFKGFKRPIGEWNCRHFAFPFSTQFSKPKYTSTQLQNWINQNHDTCEIDGKQRTKYECTQMMRKIETEVRRWKDTAVLAQIAGDDTLRRECQTNINKLVAKYGQIEDVSGIRGHRNRMTVQGFKPVRINSNSK